MLESTFIFTIKTLSMGVDMPLQWFMFFEKLAYQHIMTPQYNSGIN